MAIKVFRSTDAGAPSLTGQLGTLITFFDAILVNGYNSVSVSSITRSSSIATVTTSAAHGLQTGDSATIAGADQSDYNIDAVVTVTSGTTFTYAVANSPATPATGTITCKRSPAGFGKTYSGTNKAVYRSNDLTSNRLYLRVVDNAATGGGAREAQGWTYETMTDVDTGTGPGPTAAQSTNGYCIPKSDTADSTARAWVVISDGKIFYVFAQTNGTAASGLTNTGSSFNPGCFGDFLSYKPGDAYNTIMTWATTFNNTTNSTNGLINQQVSITGPTTFSASCNTARDFTAVAGSRYVGLYGSGLNSIFGSNAYINFPGPVDNGFYVNPVVITQTTPTCIRGRLPGVYEGMHGRCLNNGDTITGVQGLSGRTFMMLYVSNPSGGGHLLVDITGPWDS